MAKKIKEQIDYQGRRERMDPNLERKLASPESLYATNPALRKGAKDVQRLVSSRFGKVADKLKEVTGIQDISSKQVQGMIYQEMMSKLPEVMRIESRHRKQLEELAKEASLDESEIPSDWFKIEANLNREPIDVSNFRYEPEQEDDEVEGDEINEMILFMDSLENLFRIGQEFIFSCNLY